MQQDALVKAGIATLVTLPFLGPLAIVVGIVVYSATYDNSEEDPHVVSLERTWVTGLEPVNGFGAPTTPGSPAPSASAGSHRSFVG